MEDMDTSRTDAALAANVHATLEGCLADSWLNKRRGPTNPRYRGFDQAVFTSGDEDQLRRHVVLNALLMRLGGGAATGVDAATMARTIRYFFYKLKKGVYVSFRNGRLSAFEPFSNADYVNDFYHRMWTDARDRRDLARLRGLQRRIEQAWPAAGPDVAAWHALAARAHRRLGSDR